jgi:hypothetical protein
MRSLVFFFLFSSRDSLSLFLSSLTPFNSKNPQRNSAAVPSRVSGSLRRELVFLSVIIHLPCLSTRPACYSSVLDPWTSLGLPLFIFPTRGRAVHARYNEMCECERSDSCATAGFTSPVSKPKPALPNGSLGPDRL